MQLSAARFGFAPLNATRYHPRPDSVGPRFAASFAREGTGGSTAARKHAFLPEEWGRRPACRESCFAGNPDSCHRAFPSGRGRSVSDGLRRSTRRTASSWRGLTHQGPVAQSPPAPPLPPVGGGHGSADGLPSRPPSPGGSSTASAGSGSRGGASESYAPYRQGNPFPRGREAPAEPNVGLDLHEQRAWEVLKTSKGGMRNEYPVLFCSLSYMYDGLAALEEVLEAHAPPVGTPERDTLVGAANTLRGAFDLLNQRHAEIQMHCRTLEPGASPVDLAAATLLRITREQGQNGVNLSDPGSRRYIEEMQAMALQAGLKAVMKEQGQKAFHPGGGGGSKPKPPPKDNPSSRPQSGKGKGQAP